VDIDIQHIGELSKDGVFSYCTDTGKFIYINEPFAAIFENSREELIDQPAFIFDLIRSEDRFYLRHRYAELVKEKSIAANEFRIHFPNGNVKHVRCDAYLIGDVEIIGFLRDISKEKEHEDYIINYGARKDTLLDMITHNLSGPLYLTNNIIELLQKSLNKNRENEVSAHLQLLQANTQECIDIVNDFLRTEHLESERIFVKKTRFDLLERIMATLEKLIVTNKNKKFRVITDLVHLDINTDSVKFFQAIHNLVSNAIKFTPDGGEINIIIEEKETTFIISVRDTGIGIPSHLHPQLFERYSNAGRNGLNNEQSSGVGLHIVKMLVGLMGGKVWFESEENKGSTFSIELPKD
jgi:two-component system, OmpR family, sensor histidine kinase VicK